MKAARVQISPILLCAGFLTFAGCAPTADLDPKATSHLDTIAINDRLRFTIQTVNLAGKTEPWVTVAVSRVDREGNIDVPLLGPVTAAGKKRAELAEQVRQALKRSSEVEDMSVTIEYVEKAPNVSIQSGPIMPGDNLLFQIDDLEALGKQSTRVFTVDATGCITPPLLKPMTLINLSEYQAEQACANAYRDANVITNPQIHIERISAREAAILVARQSPS
jgi:protein involved in polysaccharide export with SLBB domain